MPTTKEKDTKQETLSTAIRTITKSWDTIKRNYETFREDIEKQYFETFPSRKELFALHKFHEELTPDVINRRLYKHSCAVLNFMETLVEFYNGDEETKPILFLLGKQHQVLNVNEKMFLELKTAICRVIRIRMDFESAKAWDTLLQYTCINYVFEGMKLIDPF